MVVQIIAMIMPLFYVACSYAIRPFYTNSTGLKVERVKVLWDLTA